MLKLYGATLTRSSMIQWYLEELGVSYEFVALDYQAGKFRNPPPEFFAVNPMGKTPAIADGDFKLWESGAILLYLAEKYGKLPASLEQRAAIAQWVFFANATLAPFVLVDPATFATEGQKLDLPRFLKPINQLLQQQPFITGDEFTVADVELGFVLFFIWEILKINMSAYPAIVSYIQQLLARPAYQKTLGAQMLQLLA